jgi:hypothetical protein
MEQFHVESKYVTIMVTGVTLAPTIRICLGSKMQMSPQMMKASSVIVAAHPIMQYEMLHTNFGGAHYY